MAFDRNKFADRVKKTPITQTVANARTTTRTPGTEYLKRKPRAGYRLMPTLSEDKTAYYAPQKVVSWLTVEEERNGETKMKRKPVFNSRHHLNTKSDIVEEYIGFIRENSVSFDNYDDIELVLKNYRQTISPSASRTAYALELDPDTVGPDGKPAIVGMGRFEIKNSVWGQLMDYAGDNDAHEKDLVFDPFDGMNDGLWFICKYSENKYKITIKDPMRIPDEYLQMLDAVPVLESVLVYKQKDWEYQLEGLRNFDEEHKVGLFNRPEFKEIIETVHAQVRDRLLEVDASEEGARDLSTTPAQPTDSLDQDDAAERRNAIKEVQNFLKVHPELKGKFTLSKSMSVDEIRGVLEQLESALQLEGDDDDGLFED